MPGRNQTAGWGHGTIYGLFLQVDAQGLATIAEAVEKLRGRQEAEPQPAKPRRKRR